MTNPYIGKPIDVLERKLAALEQIMRDLASRGRPIQSRYQNHADIACAIMHAKEQKPNRKTRKKKESTNDDE